MAPQIYRNSVTNSKPDEQNVLICVLYICKSMSRHNKLCSFARPDRRKLALGKGEVVCFPLRRRINKTHLDPLIPPQGLISIVTLHPVFCLLAAFNHPVFDNRTQLFDRRHRLQSTEHHSTIVSSRKIASDRVKDRIVIKEYLSEELSCRTELKSNGRRMRWGLKNFA